MTRAMQLGGRGWAYVGAFVGAGVSVAANVAHSYVPPAGAAPGWRPHAGAVVGAVFWPVALLVAIEVLARVGWPVGSRWLIVRFGGLLPVAVVAALVSYRHLAGLLAYYGEDGVTSTVGPLAVDGLMVMATGALLATRPASQPRTSRPSKPDTAAGPVDMSAHRRRPVSGRRPVTPGRSDTATRVAALRTAHPDMPTSDIAERLGVSDRTVRRHLARGPELAEVSA